MERAMKALTSMVGQTTVSRTAFESLTGQIVSMRPAVGPVQLFTREMYKAIANALNQNEGARVIKLHDKAKAEVKLWNEQLPQRNGKEIVPPAAMVEWRVDASESAIGAHDTMSGKELAHALPEALIGSSSTERELYAALHVVRAWAHSAYGRVVRLCMDSFAATRNLVKGGGPVPALCDLTKQIWEECEKQRVRLVPEWVPREENTLADKLSKAWEQWYLLCPKALGRVHGLIAEAKHSTHRAARVVNVPFNQIRNVLHHAKEESSVICLVHPLWQAQSWWEIVREAEVASIPLGPVQHALVPPPDDSPWEGRPRWRLDATILDFST